jgi:A/G-specific adenine glycosylase
MDFSDEIVHWYNQNKRALPWRDTTDAYVIWLSEIILQQTRVEQGKPYFYRFLEKYPDVKSFAAAPEDDILKLWQGLGYYSRGRNMLKTARQVVEEYNSEFPVQYEQLIKLKGIGEYTAAAISSFSSNEAKAVVDGNVYRVLARYFGIDEPINSTQGIKTFRALADEVLNKQQPGLHNQAMMEFGAMLCKPKNPVCGICPVRSGCYAFKNNAVNSLPGKLNKVKVRDRYFNYFLIENDGTIVLNKRGEKDIWANMYDLPLIETPTLLQPGELLLQPEALTYFGKNLKIEAISPVFKHILTHQRLYVQFFKTKVTDIGLQPNWLLVNEDDLKKFALPKIIFIFIEKFFNL